MIDITGIDLVKFVQKVFELSIPQGLGFFHFTPNPLTEEEARGIVDRASRNTGSVKLDMDYISGRACKMVVWEKNGDLLMGDPFSAEMLKEINMVLMATDTTKMQTSIRDWAEIRGFINDSLTVGRPTFLTVGDVMPEQPVVPEVTPVVEPVVVTPDGPEGLLELNPEKPEREVLTFREMERLAEALQDLMECVEKAKKEVERAEKDYVSLVRRGVAVTKEVQRMEALQKEPKKKESEKGWFSWFRRG